MQIIVGGEAYDGPPRFEVTFDGQLLGEAAVDAAIDTATVGRFADAADKAPYVQSFAFDIPKSAFKPGGEVRVRLVNEAYGGDGSNRDRNLFLAAIGVNGRVVTLSGLATQGTTATVETEVIGEFLLLRDGNVEGVSRAPSGGWPLPSGTAVTALNDERLPAEPVAEPEKRAAVAALTLPVAVEDSTLETASIGSAPERPVATDCQRDELYNVVGFNENSNDLTPRLRERLDQIVADIGDERCRVRITGYSSRQGDHATNALFAIERAQNVLAYLRQAGLRFDSATATGGGATDQFGAEFSRNRRVVITVSP